MGKYTDDLTNLNEVRYRRDVYIQHLNKYPDSVYAAMIILDCNKVLEDARLYDE